MHSFIAYRVDEIAQNAETIRSGAINIDATQAAVCKWSALSVGEVNWSIRRRGQLVLPNTKQNHNGMSDQQQLGTEVRIYPERPDGTAAG